MADVDHQEDTTNGVANDGAEENKFQQAISAWRAIDLTHMIPILDTTASDLVTKQKDSLVERKELAQKTKDFRKLDDAEKLVEIKALLKCMYAVAGQHSFPLTLSPSIPNIHR
jgi:homeobox protein cut-like